MQNNLYDLERRQSEHGFEEQVWLVDTGAGAGAGAGTGMAQVLALTHVQVLIQVYNSTGNYSY